MGIVKKTESESVTTWFVYMIRTAGGQLYTGITTDVQRRLDEHTSGSKGARFLRGKGPLELVWQCSVPDRSVASRLEYRIKQLSRKDKHRLLAGSLDVSLLLD